MGFSKVKFIIAAVLTVVLTAIIGGGLAYHASCRGRILYGVQSDGHSLFGMTQQEAEHYFEQLGQRKLSGHTISLRSNGNVWKLQPQEFSVKPLAKATAEQAYNAGRTGTVMQQIKEQIKNAVYGCNIPFTASYDEGLLQQKIESIAEDVLVQPVNAACEIDANGVIHHVQGKSGKMLDVPAAVQAVGQPLREMQSAIIELPIAENPPFVGTDDVKNVNAVLASYTTYYRHGARGDNIALAAQQLNGVLIRSGASFSFNVIV